MPLVDLSLEQLHSYHPQIEEPDDFTAFWADTLAATEAFDLDPTFTPIDNSLALIDTDDVSFTGFGGTRVRAWLHRPVGAVEPLPCVVQYLGYSGGRGLPYTDTIYAQAGYAHLIMDTRGQGWQTGGIDPTPDDAPEAGLPHAPGFMTAGLDDPRRYYYRRVYVDAVRALQAARAHEAVDGARLFVAGASQGGGLSIAAAGLAPMVGVPLLGCAPDVPFLCHFQRAIALTDARPYAEITEYLAAWRDRADAAARTLSYFDGANLGRRAEAPTLFSVALMDAVCPPSTVYAAYHRYGEVSGQSAKQITVYPHNGHEGGGAYHLGTRLAWIAKLLARTAGFEEAPRRL